MEIKDTKTVELDVRPYLHKKLEPFQVIMDAVKGLEKDQIFILHATFKPTPLLGLMKTKGFVNQTEKLANDHWVTTFVKKKNKHLLNDQPGIQIEAAEKISKINDNRSENIEGSIIQLDNRGLEPPQPMVRTLSALEKCR